ncbi:hypothetical protein HYH03_014159 [Edaphochlamys debaryana]|uniref:Nudix hydrolase domain-containing protein n=1 Tax=Edaphochlamys debaryana TaxID=47281 RepID=A0A836BS72_9CHLO|nr:hypothetical protein HYH03_014159 [Edaphochlamys debaryana]|eukprot:KAG2487181.1 hypothetical protein HYH03_014159 [Edaphochlamys debaryana]
MDSADAHTAAPNAAETLASSAPDATPAPSSDPSPASGPSTASVATASPTDTLASSAPARDWRLCEVPRLNGEVCGWATNFTPDRLRGYAAAGVLPFAYRPEEGELYVLLSVQQSNKGGRDEHVFTFLGGKVSWGDKADARRTAAREAYEETHRLLPRRQVLEVLCGSEPACRPATALEVLPGAESDCEGDGRGATSASTASASASRYARTASPARGRGAAASSPLTSATAEGGIRPSGGDSVAGSRGAQSQAAVDEPSSSGRGGDGHAGSPGDSAGGGADVGGGGGAGDGRGGGGGGGGAPFVYYPDGRYVLFGAHLPGAWDLPERCRELLEARTPHPEALKALGLQWVPLAGLEALRRGERIAAPAARMRGGGTAQVKAHHFMAALLRKRRDGRGALDWLLALRQHVRTWHGLPAEAPEAAGAGRGRGRGKEAPAVEAEAEDAGAGAVEVSAQSWGKRAGPAPGLKPFAAPPPPPPPPARRPPPPLLPLGPGVMSPGPHTGGSSAAAVGSSAAASAAAVAAAAKAMAEAAAKQEAAAALLRKLGAPQPQPQGRPQPRGARPSIDAVVDAIGAGSLFSEIPIPDLTVVRWAMDGTRHEADAASSLSKPTVLTPRPPGPPQAQPGTGPAAQRSASPRPAQPQAQPQAQAQARSQPQVGGAGAEPSPSHRAAAGPAAEAQDRRADGAGSDRAWAQWEQAGRPHHPHPHAHPHAHAQSQTQLKPDPASNAGPSGRPHDPPAPAAQPPKVLWRLDGTREAVSSSSACSQTTLTPQLAQPPPHHHHRQPHGPQQSHRERSERPERRDAGSPPPPPPSSAAREQAYRGGGGQHQQNQQQPQQQQHGREQRGLWGPQQQPREDAGRDRDPQQLRDGGRDGETRERVMRSTHAADSHGRPVSPRAERAERRDWQGPREAGEAGGDGSRGGWREGGREGDRQAERVAVWRTADA